MTQLISPCSPVVSGVSRPSAATSSAPLARLQPSSSSTPSTITTTNTATTTSDATARQCRYKTGRCTNKRVVKPNGSMLLLCEFHRDQQNRTKKRSDMKYRHHRATQRQMERQHPPSPAQALLSRPQAPVQSSAFVQTTPVVGRPPSRPSIMTPFSVTAPQSLLPMVSTPTCVGSQPVVTLGSGVATRQSLSSSALKKTALYKISSGLRAAAMGSRISPGKARMGASRMRSLAGTFSLNRRDIVGMASPSKPLSHGLVPSPAATPTKLAGLSVPPLASRSTDSVSLAAWSNSTTNFCPHSLDMNSLLSPSLCLSPLKHNSTWATIATSAWQPEDVRLLEYFIL